MRDQSAVALHVVDDSRTDGATIEVRSSARRQAPERLRKCGLSKPLADSRQVATAKQQSAGASRGAKRRQRPGELFAVERGPDEAILGEPDRGLEDAMGRQHTKLSLSVSEHCRSGRNGRRTNATPLLFPRNSFERGRGRSAGLTLH